MTILTSNQVQLKLFYGLEVGLFLLNLYNEN